MPMNFDDLDFINRLDSEDMRGEIKNLPNQLLNAWQTAEHFPRPNLNQISHIIIAGMGGSAIGADLLAAYIHSSCAVPVTVLRGYQLPAWAAGESELVVCSSHSGNTEETLMVFDQAIDRKCKVMAISTGGKLLERSQEETITAWRFNHIGQPRAAVGFSFGLLLNLFSRMGWIDNQSGIIPEVVQALSEYIPTIDEQVPSMQNPAKRIAGQALERTPLIMAAEHLEPVARRWKTQMNELAKCGAFFEFLPESNHNTLAGLMYPENTQHKFYCLFLDSENYYDRNKKRVRLTFDEFMVSGFCTDRVIMPKSEMLIEMWKMILLGDFISFYMAMAYCVDPTPVEALENFKQVMRS